MTDIRYVVRDKFLDSVPYSETTQYIAPKKQRTEHQNMSGTLSGRVLHGPRMASILDCEAEVAYELNLDDHTYTQHRFQRHPLPVFPPPAAAAAKRRAATLRIENSTRDTGERKQMFGFRARHVMTVKQQVPLAGSKSKPQTQIQDGWYIDLDTNNGCFTRPAGTHVAFLAIAGNDVAEEIEFKHSGPVETGFPVLLVSTSEGSPRGSTSSTMEITELSLGPLDPALFRPPADFRKVDQINSSPAATFLDRSIETLAAIWRKLSLRR